MNLCRSRTTCEMRGPRIKQYQEKVKSIKRPEKEWLGKQKINQERVVPPKLRADRNEWSAVPKYCGEVDEGKHLH